MSARLPYRLTHIVLTSALAASGAVVLVSAGFVPTVFAQTPAPSTRMTEEDFRAALARLDSAAPEDRMAAANLIGQRGGRFRREATERLRAMLRGDSVAAVRAEAGRAIGRLGLRDAVPDLVTALADADTNVRVVAAAALWRLPDPSAVPALITGLGDADPQVREWCALAVGVTEDARAAEPLARALSDSAPNVRLEAVRSLARIGDPVAMLPLARVAQDNREELETRLEAVNALAAVRSPDKSNELVRLLDVDNSEVRAQVIRALGQVGDALVIPALRRTQGRPGGNRLATEIRAAIAAIEARAAQGPARPTDAPTPTPG